MKILYGVSWGKDRKKTWSGTGYSLYKALEKIVEIQDIDLEISFFQKLISSIFQLRMKQGKIYRYKYNFNKLQMKMKKKKLLCNLKGKKEPLIQIGDYQWEYKNQYIYQDLSIDSIIDFEQCKPQAYKYIPFNTNSKRLFRWRQEYQKKVYENCKGIFTMSHWLKKHLVEYSGIPQEKVHYVGAGINLDKNKIKKLEKNKNKILFVGRDFYRKGGDLVVEAFNLLKQEHNNVELYIAGPSHTPKELEGNPEGVTFLGDITYDKLCEYFNICDIFCMPSRFEPFGLVYIEALVFGMPCIANNDFAMKEIIKDGINGYLLNDENIIDLKEKMWKLLNDDDIKKNVIDNRERYIQEYSWDNVAKKMITIIKNDIR